MPARLLAERELNILPYNTGKQVVGESVIAVEGIGGPVLVVSTAADEVWPSAGQADWIMRRLDASGFAHPHEHLAYRYMSHFASPDDSPLLRLLFRTERTHRAECRREREDMNARVIAWVKGWDGGHAGG